MFFFFKQKTAYEMRISDWSSDVCSSDLEGLAHRPREGVDRAVALGLQPVLGAVALPHRLDADRLVGARHPRLLEGNQVALPVLLGLVFGPDGMSASLAGDHPRGDGRSGRCR